MPIADMRGGPISTTIDGGWASSACGSERLRIEVNGEVRQTAATTILGLVQELSLNPAKVAVERNLEIVPRSLHGETALAEGDRIELVQFVGGG